MHGHAARPQEPARLPNLFGMEREEIASALAPLTQKAFHASQVYHWMYGRLQTDFQALHKRGGLGRMFRSGGERKECGTDSGVEIEESRHRSQSFEMGPDR